MRNGFPLSLITYRVVCVRARDWEESECPLRSGLIHLTSLSLPSSSVVETRLMPVLAACGNFENPVK